MSKDNIFSFFQKATTLSMESDFLKKLEKLINEFDYSLLELVKATSNFSVEILIAEEMKKSAINRNDIFEAFIKGESARLSISGIFWALQYINWNKQKLPILGEKSSINLSKWKKYLLAAGIHVIKYDMNKKGYEYSSPYVHYEEIKYEKWLSDEFKNSAFKSVFGFTFHDLRSILYRAKSHFIDKDGNLILITKEKLRNFIEEITELDINKINIFMKLKLDTTTKASSFKPYWETYNFVTQPFIFTKYGILSTPALLDLTIFSYEQFWNFASSPYKFFLDKEILRYASEKYSGIYSSKFEDYLCTVLEENNWKTHRNILSSKWNKLNSLDLGDIDILAINEKRKIILINEVKYRKKHFFNISAKISAEKKWVNRQNERHEAIIRLSEKEYAGWDVYVNIITIEPMFDFMNLEKFNNIPLNSFQGIINELKKGKANKLSKLTK